jgi:hypothetical protein
MASDRSRYGLLVSALGSVLLAVSVFLPWYALSMTPAGAEFAQHLSQSLAAEYGNSALQPLAANLHGSLASLSGQQLAAVSAHEVLHDLNIVLLVLAGLALLDSLLALAGAGPALMREAGGLAMLLGGIAAACVLYRMVTPPVPAGGLIALSLREGCWLALLGSLMVALGGMWPRVTFESVAAEGVFIRV